MKSRASLIVVGALFTYSVLAGDGPRAGEGERLLRESTDIVVGQVVAKTSEKTRDGRMIVTRYTLRIETVLKGQTATSLEITEYGGVVGNEATYVSNSTRYVEGQMYLVFVRRDSLGLFRTLRGSNGRLPVISDEKGRSVVRLYASHPLKTALPGRSGLWELDALTTRIRSLVSDIAVQDK